MVLMKKDFGKFSKNLVSVPPLYKTKMMYYHEA